MKWIFVLQTGWHAGEYQCSDCGHYIKNDIDESLPNRCEKCECEIDAAHKKEGA